MLRLLFMAALSGLLVIPIEITGQVLETEGTYKITGKAKRGALGDVTYDAGQGVYTLTYVTKSNDRKAKFQIYQFDNDFNFLTMQEDEVEFEKAKTKYKWFNYEGEQYSTVGLYVEPNLVGTLVLRQKRITHKYDWLLLGYYRDVDILKKVKPKTDDGRKLYYHGHAEDDVTGDVLILCGIKDKVGKDMDPYRPNRDFLVLRYNKDVELVGETSFKFDYPLTPAFIRYMGPEDGSVDGMSFVFAPLGGPGMNKHADPNKGNYKYVRVDAEPNVVDNIAFESFAPYWKIDEMVHDQVSDDVYLFGPSAAGKDKYYNQLLHVSKFDAVQLLKVSNGDIAYFTETDLDEFDSKIKMPPGQKKGPSYEGKKFQIANYKIAPNGDFIVSGQNFKPSKNGPKYDDIIGFHFDQNGKLKAQYSIQTMESNRDAKAFGTEQQFFPTTDGTGLYWLHKEIVGVSNARGKLLTYPSIGRLDLESGEVSEFVSFGGEEGYYLDPLYPILETNEGRKVVFFGSDKKGKEIWFARVALD